jgi:GNAT superfamily N-acetyltransferase
MEIKFIRVTEENVENYDILWLDVCKEINARYSFEENLEVERNCRDAFLTMERSSETNYSYFDFFYYLRVLEVDGVPVGLCNGIVRWFEEGICFQIGQFGLPRRYQKKGFGTIFINRIHKELTSLNTKYSWGYLNNEKFWEKVGYVKETTNLFEIYDTYDYDSKKTMYKKLSDNQPDFNSFIEILTKYHKSR